MRYVAKTGIIALLVAIVAGFAYFGSKVEAITVKAIDSQESIQFENTDDENVLKFDVPVEVESETETAVETAEAAASGGRSFRATAYCLRGKTASGRYVRRGIVAADPRVLRLGTRIHMTGGRYTGNYIVADTGGKIKGNILDIWVPSCSEARSWGRRSVKVKVISKGKKKKKRYRRKK